MKVYLLEYGLLQSIMNIQRSIIGLHTINFLKKLVPSLGYIYEEREVVGEKRNFYQEKIIIKIHRIFS